MNWNLPANDDFNLDDVDTEIPEAPKPAEKTVLVDFVTEAEAPKTYVASEDEPRPKDVRKAEGIKSYAPPVDIHETGFRSDVYEGLVEFFKQKRETRIKLDALRKKIGLRG